MKKLILASQSPRRQKILKEAGFTFEIIPADINEESYEHLTPEEMVRNLSKLKAEKIAEENPDAVVIGADTTVNLNGKIIGKPKDLEDARGILSSLSNTTHEVITAYTIIEGNKKQTFYEISYITFRNITDEQIEEYINSINVLGFAGAYGIQDGADKFVEKFEGDYLNIVGLPSSAVKMLEEYNVK